MGSGSIKTQCGFPAGEQPARDFADSAPIVITLAKQARRMPGTDLHDLPQPLGVRIWNAGLQKPDDDNRHFCASVYGYTTLPVAVFGGHRITSVFGSVN